MTMVKKKRNKRRRIALLVSLTRGRKRMEMTRRRKRRVMRERRAKLENKRGRKRNQVFLDIH